MEKLRLFFLYLYLFSLSIENWSPFGDITSLFRPALIFGILYVLFSFIRIKRNFEINEVKYLLKPAFLVWLWITIISLLYHAFTGIAPFFNYTLLSCIISFWLLSNDLQHYPLLKNHFLYIIIINGVLLSMLSYFQIGIDIGHMGRQSLLGNNSNVIGLSSLISIVLIIYLVIENHQKLSKSRFLLLFIIPFLLQAIAKTGSKGALLTLVIGLTLYLITLNKPVRQKIPLFFLGILSLVYGYVYMLQNEVLADRWEEFVETGDTTGRAMRWEFALNTFIDYPFFGVGENGLAHLASFVFGSYDPHNVYLYVMATGGVFAIIPFFLFLLRIYKKINLYKKAWNSNLPFVLYFILLMFWFKAGGGLNSKFVWAYFALISHQPYNYIYTKYYAVSNTRDKN